MTRSIFRLSFALALPFFLLTTFMVTTSSFALAQNSGITQITGVVLDAQRHPVGAAQVRLSGAASKTTSTAADGSFAFLNIPPGIFRLDISKAGFNSSTQDDIVISAGSTTNLGFTLQAASLTSLTVIGNVSVNAHGANSINTTPASIVDIPASNFTDQGQLSVNQVLNEEPGVAIGVAVTSSGASPLATGVPSVRGGLPYETESLIDGHPISLGQSGYFSPSYMSPYLLQNVEVVKGPGATSPSINYAINGTINYRTLEPTVKPQASVDFDMDQYGGNFANFRATGTLPGGRFSYAFDYITQGTQGPVRGFTAPTEVFQGTSPTLLNGVPISADAGISVSPGPTYGSFIVNNTFLVCCPAVPMWSNQRNELGKIRYSFTPSTVLTVTYLGGQTSGAYGGGQMLTFNYVDFTPPAGYTGSLPPGLAQSTGSIPFLGGWYSSMLCTEDVNLFEAEFHTPLGKTATLLLRQYSSSIQTYVGGPGSSTPSTETLTAAIYGGIYYAGATTPTIFNGQIGTFTGYQYYENRSYNDLNGYTAEIDKQTGDDLLSLSYDEEKTSTHATQNYCGGSSVVVPAGSSQTFQSLMGRAQFEFAQRVNGTISDNFGSYTDTYTQDGGLTFQQATHTYEAPRLSLTWRPNANQSVRAAIGTSIAPPYIALLNNNQVTSVLSISPLEFSETVNSGDVLPETAFGFDLGFDSRLHSPYTVVSVDFYQTLLRNQFLQETYQDGDFTCQPTTGGGCHTGETGPLYVTATANLGHSEYEGVELSLHRTPPTGWGYRIQGSLQRAFVYDLPAGFYDTALGPDTANLSILSNENFRQGGLVGGLGVSIPYSTGYGEIDYRGHNGAYFLAGITYYGPNNSYAWPAFGVVTVSYNQPLTRRTSLQLSIYNLTNTYPQLNPEFAFNTSAIQTPLVNGQVINPTSNVIGPETARLTLHVDL